MRRVVSVSLGSSTRDWEADLGEFGVPLKLERRGVGLDYTRYAEALRELDADDSVAAIGMGGINRYLFAGDRKYGLRKADEMVAAVRHKPVCDGAGLKRYWEPFVLQLLSERGVLPLRGRRVLMVCAVDRWGMASALAAAGADLVLGDLIFGLGVPMAIRGLDRLEGLARMLLPAISRWVPFEWLYPTGESKDVPKYPNWYAWADVLAGDWKFIAKHMPGEPGSLQGKAIVTNTTTPADVEVLRHRGVELLVTTTPSLGGRSFGTNVVEAAVAAITGDSPDKMTLDDYLPVFRRLGWDEPRVERLQPST